MSEQDQIRNLEREVRDNEKRIYQLEGLVRVLQQQVARLENQR